MKRVQLVSAGLSEFYVKSPRTGVYPPLNIAGLASYLRSACRDVSVELLDGEITGTDAISRAVGGDVVGISCNVMTYRSALDVAKAASEKGCRVVLGGPYPSAFAERIIRERPY